MPDRPPPTAGTPYAIPEEGSLGLLALGYRGLVAWRAERGTDWIEERRIDYEAALEQRKAKEREEGKGEAGSPAEPVVAPAPSAALDDVSLTVVTGLPRSGTSMLMQMLVAGGLTAFTDRAREADASNPHGYFEHARVKALAHDQGWLPDADGHVVKIVAPLLPHLPPTPAYRVVFLDRDLDEILGSQTTMLGRLDRPAADPTLLRPVYERHLAAAHRWIGWAPRAEALVLAHRDVVQDPAASAARLNAFLGGGLDEAAMAAAVDPTLYRQRAE